VFSDFTVFLVQLFPTMVLFLFLTSGKNSLNARYSTAYHPQTDGLTERTNQTLETYLRTYCSYQQDDWVDYLPLAEFSFNSSENTSTHSTPFYANLGFNPSFEPEITERSTVPTADDLAHRLDHIQAELRAELEFVEMTQAKYYDQHHLPAPKFVPDQHIKTNHPSDKLDHRRLGPYRVIKKVGKAAYHLDLPSYLSRLYPVFNVSLLEPYNDPSEFHPHSDPIPFSLSKDPVLAIQSILDC
jgi:hypothetical protein